MKKSITQFTAMMLFLIIGSSANAQCTGTVNINNKSGDVWTINYYGSNITVQPQSTVTLGFLNASPSLSRGAMLGSQSSSTSACTHNFQDNLEVWSVPCAPNTSEIIYKGVLDSATGCYNVADYIIDLVING
jgi:hypothetical protein